jgi:predicted transglutaminase-like cysteine proteinase
MWPIAGLLSLVACANAPPSHMPLGDTVAQPLGAELFCLANATECSHQRSATQQVKMTPELWSELLSVQYDINRKFRPTRETRFAWDYSSDGTGNCVQFALEKRRALIMRGWPPGALQLATAVIRPNIGHLVLVIDTEDGDWVLDNLSPDVVRWQLLPYRWIARQQGAAMENWVAVGGEVETNLQSRASRKR